MWRRSIIATVFLLALAALAAWQGNEYRHECDTARAAAAGAAESVMSALVSGARSHRRLGRFFAENMQGVLDGLAQSNDVRAVALVAEDGKSSLRSGEADLLELSPPLAEGGHWQTDGYELVRSFRLPAENAGRGGQGGGLGGGPGAGRGWGRRWQDDEDPAGPFAANSTAAAVLLFDRTRADEVCRHAAWLRGSIVIAGAVVLFSAGWAWAASVRLVEARGRTRTLETESRYYRDLSQAAAGLAHETRNPLGLIRGWTQRLMESDCAATDAQRQAQAVIEECDRVTARINQFLAFARPSVPRPEPVDAGELIGELAALLEPDLAAKTLTLDRPPPGSTIRADRELLRQALFNLLQNAIQASPDGGRVETSVDVDRRGQYRLAIADRGPGVAAESVAKLFTPYFTTRSDGTGLGLAIVRRIAAAHGWEVGYTPRPGGGVIFWLDGIHG